MIFVHRPPPGFRGYCALTATHFFIAVRAVAFNSHLQSQYGLIQNGGHTYPPKRVLFHNLVLDHLANATGDGVAAALACYGSSSREDKALPLVGRLAEALFAAQADIQRLRESFQHEQERSKDVSRFGFGWRSKIMNDQRQLRPIPLLAWSLFSDKRNGTLSAISSLRSSSRVRARLSDKGVAAQGTGRPAGKDRRRRRPKTVRARHLSSAIRGRKQTRKSRSFIVLFDMLACF